MSYSRIPTLCTETHNELWLAYSCWLIDSGGVLVETQIGIHSYV